MALSYDGDSFAGIGVAATEVVPAVSTGKTGFLQSLLLANVSGGSINVYARITRSGGASTSMLINGAPIPAGSTLEVVDRPPILLEGDKVEAWASVAASLDVTTSVVYRS